MERKHHKLDFDCDKKKACKPEKKCEKVEKKCDKNCRKKCCRPKKCEKKSSSSESCEKPCEKQCVPKVVYQACINQGVASLKITAVVDTPNHDSPPTFTCPSNIGQKIYITFTVTNTGNTAIRSPIYIYDSFTGVHKVTCDKLHAGSSQVITVNHKISKCQCNPGNNLSIVANAYSDLYKNCLILVSEPISIIINQSV